MTEAYWAKRIFADERKAQRMAAKMLRESRKAYRKSYKRILREVEGLYAQAVTGEPITRTQLWQYAHWRGLTKELRTFVQDGSQLEEKRLTKVLDGVFRSVIGADASIFDGREWRARLNPAAVINTAWSGENYSNRIWNNRSALAVRLREQVTQGVLDGKPVGKMAKELESAFAVSYKQAERLARTETSYVFNRASLARYEALGITRVKWITGVNDGKECSICSGRSGQVYNLNDAPIMPAHPNCRCAWGAVVGEDRDDHLRETRDSLQPMPQNRLTGTADGGILNTEHQEMFRRLDISRTGFRFISDEHFDRLTIEARKNGANIIRGDPEWERHLDDEGAAASTIGDTMIFRKQVTVSEVLEETRHFEQNRIGLNDDSPEPLRTILNEIEAREYIFANANRYHVPRVEIEFLKRQYDGYQKQLQALMEGE